VSPEDAEAISIKAAEDVWNGKDYEEALNIGREEILELIK
jgi:energy-converting hydrogenase A subunit M